MKGLRHTGTCIDCLTYATHPPLRMENKGIFRHLPNKSIP